VKPERELAECYKRKTAGNMHSQKKTNQGNIHRLKQTITFMPWLLPWLLW